MKTLSQIRQENKEEFEKIINGEVPCVCSGRVTLPIQHLKECPFYKKGEVSCCSKCFNSVGALKGKNKEKFGCGVPCECHWPVNYLEATRALSESRILSAIREKVERLIHESSTELETAPLSDLLSYLNEADKK